MFALEKRLGFMTDGPDTQEAITNAIDPIARRIFALPAVTPAGFAVKARAAAYEHAELWDDEFDDLDWEDKFVRSLIEGTLAMAGAELPLEEGQA
jgi:hypothetical protein